MKRKVITKETLQIEMLMADKDRYMRRKLLFIFKPYKFRKQTIQASPITL
ncbi:hypothetical protein [Clostridium sp. HCS.1]